MAKKKKSKKRILFSIDEKVAVGIFILFLIVGILTQTGFKTPQPKKLSHLPQGWVTISTSDKSIKVQKQSDQKFKPTITLIYSQTDQTNPKKFIDNSILGARVTLPTLVISKRSDSKRENYYVANLAGYYISANQKINIYQKIFIKNYDVYTIAASYLAKDNVSQKELDSIFRNIYDLFLP